MELDCSAPHLYSVLTTVRAHLKTEPMARKVCAARKYCVVLFVVQSFIIF